MKKEKRSTKVKYAALAALVALMGFGLCKYLSRPKYYVGECLYSKNEGILIGIEAIKNDNYVFVVALPGVGVVGGGQVPIKEADKFPGMVEVDCKTGEPKDAKSN